MADFKLRRLHRQRTRRRHDVEVLGGQELALRLDLPVEALQQELQARGWPHHHDSSGTVWMTLRKHSDLPAFEQGAGQASDQLSQRDGRPPSLDE